ncbi:SGNH hydrolase [Xylariaceae sp. FL1272]|nr:SGNH hydrolase [Xylariaceae sp. FL1272]
MYKSAVLLIIAACQATTEFIVQPEKQHALKLSDINYERPPRLSSFSRNQNDTSSPSTGFVAFGDSYSAGIGTGVVHGEDDSCLRGLNAHAELIAADLSASQGGPNTTAFQFLSCTGSTTEDVLISAEKSQIDSFNVSLPAEFALLSIGGNDLGFFDVINACVFRFYNFYSGTCETALANSRARLESDEFENRLEVLIMEILDKVRWEKKPWFFITMTGYARFFNENTDACDDMSFGVWWRGPKLTKELRSGMNALVLTVNAKLKSAVDTINSRFTIDKVIFVDYDGAFDGHRFCEPNVTEPDYNRSDTWFFLVGGHDNERNGTKPLATSDTEMLPSASPLVDPTICLEPALRSGDWGMLALCYMAMAKHNDPSLRLTRRNELAVNGGWHAPIYYAKTFHPRTLGHEAIRDAIYRAWRKFDPWYSTAFNGGLRMRNPQKRSIIATIRTYDSQVV